MPVMPQGQTDLYSPWTGCIYVFNLIVGTGALTLPAAFQQAGWFLGLGLIIFLAFMSFITSTFVIESMAATNAMAKWKKIQQLKSRGAREQTSVSEKEPLVQTTEVDKLPVNLSDYYRIEQQTEMGKMASSFFGKNGVRLFYISLIIYLYGDLAIYSTAIAKSIRDVACDYIPSNVSCNATLNTTSPCWGSHIDVSRGDAYRIFLGVFAALLGPFAFFNVQKTKYLQILTTVLRWTSFSVMIVLAGIRISEGKHLGHPRFLNFHGIPNFLGVCIYSFMCHHSLPALLTPINDKTRLNVFLAVDYVLILLFYNLLSFTAIFSMDNLPDLYTLAFEPSSCEAGVSLLLIVQYFLVLYPVSTLSTNFPIIAITLRNNLRTMFLKEGKRYGCFTRYILFPFLAITPPLMVSFITENVEFLVGMTGSYAGSVIQYVIPALLVYYGRKEVTRTIGLGVKNHHSSPFRHTAWVVFVNIWAVTSVIFVTVNHILEAQ